jgi:Mlo family
MNFVSVSAVTLICTDQLIGQHCLQIGTNYMYTFRIRFPFFFKLCIINFTILSSQGEAPLLSVEAIHQLHIFIFVLALTHVVLSLITVLLGRTQVDNIF